MKRIESGSHSEKVCDVILRRITELGISKTELAARADEHVQTVSAILNGARNVTIPLSVRLDRALDYPVGTIAAIQTQYLVSRAVEKDKVDSVQKKVQAILEKIKANGGFWSYEGIPQHLEDDTIIEEALVHLDLEDLPLLLGIWNKVHIRKVWKERLVSQGKRMSVLNYILAVKFFSIANPTKYITRYAHN